MSELRPLTQQFRAEHAELLRKVAKWMTCWKLGRLYRERVLVALMLSDMADKIDAAFAAPKPSNVVRLPVRKSGGASPQPPKDAA